MRRGFTLLELSIVLAIIAVVIGGGIVMFTASIQKSQSDATVAKMDAIEGALLNYTNIYGRLPCPGDLTQTATSSPNYYGLESDPTANPGSCRGGNPAPNLVSGTVNAVEGSVPVRALQLPDSYMYDGWGRHFGYAVDASMTITGSFPPALGPACYPSLGITVNDATGAARTTTAVYAIISHGANGHGGYTLNGSMYNASNGDASKDENCHCNSNGFPSGTSNGPNQTVFDGTYIQKAPALTPGTPKNVFDDIVTFKEAWQMRSPSTSFVSLPACMWATDATTNIFNYGNAPALLNTTGTWSGEGMSFTSTNGIATDNNGNVYITDPADSEIWKFNPTINRSIFVSGLSAPVGVAVDNSGNVWIANTGASSILEYTNAAVSVNISAISAAAALSFPKGLYIDNSGNILVADTGHHCIKYYNGSIWKTFGTSGVSGSAAGLFYSPAAVYEDAAGNIWVADTANNRVQKCSLTNDCTQTANWKIYGTSSVSTAAGQFNAPAAITGDVFGNIWVADTGNNRIQVYRNSAWSIFSLYYAANSPPYARAFQGPNGFAVGR